MSEVLMFLHCNGDKKYFKRDLKNNWIICVIGIEKS